MVKRRWRSQFWHTCKQLFLISLLSFIFRFLSYCSGLSVSYTADWIGFNFFMNSTKRGWNFVLKFKFEKNFVFRKRTSIVRKNLFASTLFFLQASIPRENEIFLAAKTCGVRGRLNILILNFSSYEREVF